MAHLWDGCMQQLTDLPTTGEPMTMYGLQLRYPAAALFPSSSNWPHRPPWTYRRWTSAWKITTRLRH